MKRFLPSLLHWHSACATGLTDVVFSCSAAAPLRRPEGQAGEAAGAVREGGRESRGPAPQAQGF